jgi:hypothetical protein
MGGDHDSNLYFVHIRYRTKAECKEWSTTLYAKTIADAERRARKSLRAADRNLTRLDTVSVR